MPAPVLDTPLVIQHPHTAPWKAIKDGRNISQPTAHMSHAAGSCSQPGLATCGGNSDGRICSFILSPSLFATLPFHFFNILRY